MSSESSRDGGDGQGTSKTIRARGRAAMNPAGIPLLGWRDVLLRVWRSTSTDNLSLISAGVAFFAMLAVFPALTASVSLYGLLFGPHEASSQVSELTLFMPGDARDVLLAQLRDITSTEQTTLGVGLVVSLLLAIWSATKGIRALISALNIVYGESERRGYVKLSLLCVLFTAGGVLYVTLALALIALLPILPGHLGLGEVGRSIAISARWPLLAAGGLIALSVVYRFGPCRSSARWRWVTWGSAVSMLLWLGASAGFSFYVSSFAKYNETYGGLGAVVVLLMWFYLSAYLILLGGELNAELEHQTCMDSTEGTPRPMGLRGAHVANTLGEVP